MINSKIDWKIGKTKNNVTIEWIPICSLVFSNEYKRIIGLTKDGFWVNGFESPRNEDLYMIKSREDCYYIMAIIDKERTDVENQLLNGLKLNNISTDVLNTFPFNDIIKFSLTSTNYWGIRATSWIRQKEFDDELYNIGQSIIDKKGLDQRSRHDLFKMMQRFKK